MPQVPPTQEDLHLLKRATGPEQVHRGSGWPGDEGQAGEGVTIISDLPLDEKGITELATKLKTRLGTGGTVKDGRIEIQGDHRDRVVEELEAMGYRVKRVGR